MESGDLSAHEALVEELGELYYEASKVPYSAKGLRAVLACLARKGADGLPRCQQVDCHNPAACFVYQAEGEDVEEYACNVCCGHGNEDAHCVPVESDAVLLPLLAARDAALAEAERVIAVRDAQILVYEKERDEARDWVRRLTAAEVLTAHIRVCPKHPMRNVEKALNEARRDRDAYSTMLQSQAVDLASARAEVERLRRERDVGPEPNADMVERLRVVFHEERKRIERDPQFDEISPDPDELDRAGFCAVLDTLAQMGLEETLHFLPSEEEIGRSWWDDAEKPTPQWVRDFFTVRMSPILAALRAENGVHHARAEAAEKRLAAVMALTEDDLTSRIASCQWGDNPVRAVLDLIRSRAEEGGE